MAFQQARFVNGLGAGVPDLRLGHMTLGAQTPPPAGTPSTGKAAAAQVFAQAAKLTSQTAAIRPPILKVPLSPLPASTPATKPPSGGTGADVLALMKGGTRPVPTSGGPPSQTGGPVVPAAPPVARDIMKLGPRDWTPAEFQQLQALCPQGQIPLGYGQCGPGEQQLLAPPGSGGGGSTGGGGRCDDPTTIGCSKSDGGTITTTDPTTGITTVVAGKQSWLSTHWSWVVAGVVGAGVAYWLWKR